MRAARRLTLSLLAAIATLAALVGPVGVARAAVSPTVAITAPVAGATVSGLVSVTVAGNVDPTEVGSAQTVLQVDGTAYGLPKSCDYAVYGANCPTAFTWDSTGLAGAHVLQVRLTTPSDPSGVTSSVSVTAVNPAPTVTITSPTPGAVAHGTLSVAATGSVDLSQNETPVSLQLWVDNLKYGLPVACTVVVTTAKTCDGTFTVAQPTWSGAHSVQVTLTTSAGSAASAIVPWFAYTATKVVLSPIAAVHSGRLAVIRGRAVAVNNGGPLVGARVAVTLVPAVGRKHTLIVHTGATGRFSLATKVAVNTTVVAVVRPMVDFGTSRAGGKVGVLAPIVCTVARTVRHGRFDAGACTVAHLPDGTRVSLQYESHKKWHVLGAGTTSGTTIPVSFQFGAPGSYPMRLVLGANKAYVATYGTPFVVTVT